MPLHFTQSCPTCGRRLEVHTQLLGRQVACQHCQAVFVATSDDEDGGSWEDASQSLLARAEAALRQTQPLSADAVTMPSLLGPT